MLNPSSSNMPTSGSERPGLGEKQHQSSRRNVVDFDSENLLSMQDIRENVRLTASKLLNDDLDTSDEEEDYGDHDQLPHAEDARVYAGRLLGRKDRSSRMSKQHSIRKPLNILRSVRMMKDIRKTSDPTFASDVDAMSMELDMDDDLPQRRFARHKLYCILGSLVLVAIATTIIVLFANGDNDTNGNPPPVSAPVPHDNNAPAPQGDKAGDASLPPGETSGPPSEAMQSIIDFLVSKGVSDSTALNTDGTPQRQAADWIANIDTMLYNPHDDESRIIQRYAIATLYFALNGPEWKHPVNFLAPKEVCSWFREIPDHSVNDVYSIGVTCNGYLQVETIMLPGNNLAGSLPPELGLLTALDFVSLKHNKIVGPFPDSLQMLSNLEYFDVQYNQMTGTLPSWFGDTMQNVRDLSLSDNQFEGPLPKSMANMEHLTTLAIDDNNFTGDIAPIANALGALKYLYADNNAFDSKIDFQFLTESMNMEELDLSGNQFTSDELPLHLFLMQNLRVLDLHDNALEGSITDTIPGQTSLEFLSLYGNSLTGSIPRTIHALSGLTHLDLSRNLFTGAPPDSISYLKDLRYLYLSDNAFDSGEVPAFYQDLGALEEFSMAKAKRTGTIPEWFADLDNLMLLDLSENELTGTVPDSIFDLPALRFLLLHRNQLTGTVQDGIIRANTLDMLTTDRNEIEDDWSEVCELGRPEFLSADCGDFQQVYCTCCTVCCEESNPQCNDEIVLANLDARWENDFSRTAYDFGPNSIFEGDDADEYDEYDEFDEGGNER